MKTFKIAMFVAVVCVFLLPSCNVFATWNSYQLTDNSEQDKFPTIDGRNVSWWSQTNGMIMYQNIDEGGAHAIGWGGGVIRPSASDGKVAWMAVDSETSQQEVFVWNGGFSEQMKITSDGGDKTYASYSNGKIAWTKDGFVYYSADGETVNQATSDNSSEDVSVGPSVIAYNHDSSIYAYSNSQETQVTTPMWPCSDNGAAVDPVTGNIAFVRSNSDTGATQIMLWDGSTERAVSPDEYEEYSPSVYDGKMVWSGYDGNDYEIFYWDGTNTWQVTDTAANEFYPTFRDGLIAWQVSDGTDNEIMIAQQISEAESYVASVVADLGLGYTSSEMLELASLYESADTETTITIGENTWHYLPGILPGDDGSKAIGDMWEYEGMYYIKLGSGLEMDLDGGATTVPELPPFAAQGMAMMFGGLSVWMRARRRK